MPEHTLTFFGNSILRTPAEEVPLGDIGNSFYRKLTREMKDIMEVERGTGIAAPQVGVSFRFALILLWDDSEEEKPQELLVAYNPRITKFSNDKSLDWEGCLSLPDVWGKVPRSTSITFEYTNESGESIIRELTGFNARVAQHEVDHLDGILFVDRMTSMETLSTKKEAYKRMKEEQHHRLKRRTKK